MDAVIAVVALVVIGWAVVKLARIMWVVAEAIIKIAKSIAIIGGASVAIVLVIASMR
jgi:hypothetical protein